MERVAVGFNPNITLEDAASYAYLSEGSGYESFWVHENPFIKDAVSLLSSAIKATGRIKLGSGCVSVTTRHPLLATTSFLALNEMSHGRAIMGVGLGGFPWLPKIGVRVFPVEETKPLQRVREFLTITRGLLDGESVTLDGRFFKVSDLKLEKKPDSQPLVYLAAFGPKLLAMASRYVDGVIVSPAMMTPETTGEKVKLIKQEGRGEVDVASYILTNVSSDAEKARDITKSYYFLLYQVAEVLKPSVFEPYGVGEEDLKPVKEAWARRDIPAAAKALPDEVVDALTLTGRPEDCAARLDDYRKAGVRLPIIMPIGDVKAAIKELAP